MVANCLKELLEKAKKKGCAKSVMVGVLGDYVWTLDSKSFFVYLILKIKKSKVPTIFCIFLGLELSHFFPVLKLGFHSLLLYLSLPTSTYQPFQLHSKGLGGQK